MAYETERQGSPLCSSGSSRSSRDYPERLRCDADRTARYYNDAMNTTQKMKQNYGT